MNSTKTKLMQILGYGGLVPFLLTALAELMALELPVPVEPMTLLLTYGAIILSFLPGPCGDEPHRADSEPTNLLLISVMRLRYWHG